MSRKRFKTSALASSHNYESFRKIHREYLTKEHEAHASEVEQLHLEIGVEVTIVTPTRVWFVNKWIELGPCDANSFQGFELK